MTKVRLVTVSVCRIMFTNGQKSHRGAIKSRDRKLSYVFDGVKDIPIDRWWATLSLSLSVCVCVCVRACVRACVQACMRVYVRAFICVYALAYEKRLVHEVNESQFKDADSGARDLRMRNAIT